VNELLVRFVFFSWLGSHHLLIRRLHLLVGVRKREARRRRFLLALKKSVWLCAVTSRAAAPLLIATKTGGQLRNSLSLVVLQITRVGRDLP
jgi:hypothetical protein